MFKKTVRIQLFDKKGMLSDRLITQVAEFYQGPKEKHEGPMRIEFTFEDSSDVNGAIDYLKELSGLVPIRETSGRGRKANDHDNDKQFSADKEKILKETIEEFSKNQDTFIKALRDMGFIFVTGDYLKHIIPEEYIIKERHIKDYDFLIRKVKEAKDPKNDKFDPQIIIGIGLSTGRKDKMVSYLYGEFKETFKIKVPDKNPLKASKTNLIKFPHYMEEEERFKWGLEHRALFNNPDKKPSKFYMRFSKDTKVGEELSISKEDLLERLSK